MIVSDIIKSIDAGKIPVIKFGKYVDETDIDLDPNMIGEIKSYRTCGNGSDKYSGDATIIPTTLYSRHMNRE